MPAAAGILEDRKICDGNGAAEPQIHACGRLIASGRFKGRDLGVTYNNRAFAYLMTKDFTRAVLDYDMAIQLAPTVEDTWFGRGRAWAGRGEWQRAMGDFNRAIELKPESRAPLRVARRNVCGVARLRARARRFRAGHSPGAGQQPVRLSYARRHPSPLRQLRRRDLKSRSGAADQSRRHLRLRQPRPCVEREGRQRSRAGRRGRGAAHRAELGLCASSCAGWSSAARATLARAIADFDETIRLSPKDARAYAWRGQAYEQSGDTARASSDFQAALAVTEGRKDDREQAQAVARERLRVLEAARQQPVTVAAMAPSVAAAPDDLRAADRRVAHRSRRVVASRW